MGFVKIGDAQPVIETHEGDSKLVDEETKKILEAAKQAAKKITENGNNLEFTKKSNEDR